MKRLLVAVLLAITGCDSPPAPIDAGADGGAADVPVASDGGATDSGIGDGGDDDDAPRDSADAPDAFVPPPPVTVVISDGTAPHEGADVLWYDDAGTLTFFAINRNGTEPMEDDLALDGLQEIMDGADAIDVDHHFPGLGGAPAILESV